MNEIFNEDCYKTLTKRDIEYDYVCFSPPDYDELDMEPEDPKWITWQKKIYKKLNPKSGVVTIVNSMRKHKRFTVPKDVYIYNVMFSLGYKLVTKKVWIKPKIDPYGFKLGERNNLYRYDNAYIMTFANKNNFKSKGTKRYRADNWTEDYKAEKFGEVKYTYHYPETMINRCIENFTEPGDVVYDPFVGIGTTAIASHNMGRNYYGSEIDTDVYNIAVERLKKLKKVTKSA